MAKENTTSAEQDLHAQIAELHEEIKKIASTVGAIGSEHLHKTKSKAEAFYGQAKQQSEDALKDAKNKIHDAERHIAHHVREKPVESLAVAALTGAVLALILRR